MQRKRAIKAVVVLEWNLDWWDDMAAVSYINSELNYRYEDGSGYYVKAKVIRHEELPPEERR